MKNRVPSSCVLLLSALAACMVSGCSENRELLHHARAGEAIAQFEYGRRLLTGQHCWRAHPEKAHAWFRLAAEQDYAAAQAALGACYEAGLGVESSTTEARHWYTLAAAQGHPEATMQLAIADFREEKDPQRALTRLEALADAGHLKARLLYASLLLKKEPITLMNLRAAMDQLRIAAMDGSAEAAYLMGLFYAGGIGVPQHAGIANGWFRNAAEAGFNAEQETEEGEPAPPASPIPHSPAACLPPP